MSVIDTIRESHKAIMSCCETLVEAKGAKKNPAIMMLIGILLGASAALEAAIGQYEDIAEAEGVAP